MSEEFEPTSDESEELKDAGFEGSDEYEEIEEEISSDEVDRVLEPLTGIMEKVESETIHEILEEAYNQIFGLVYEEEVDVDGEVAIDDELETDEDVDADEEFDVDDDFEDTAEAA